jgi:hypothetical protein
MATLTLHYNAHDALAQSIISSIKQAGVFTITESRSPYNKEFVRQIQESRNGPGQTICTKDLWT